MPVEKNKLILYLDLQVFLCTFALPLKNSKHINMSIVESNEEREKAIKVATDKIDKDFGKGSVMTLSEIPSFDKNNVVPTGSIGLNQALGIGGLPKGRIVEIYGPESSGKTTIAIHVIAEAQKKGGKCAFIDMEHAFDKDYAAALGVDIDDLKFSQPDYGEQALEIADRLINTGAFDVVVIDSVAALVPKAELDGEMGDSKMGLQARLMSQACRKLVGSVSKNNTLLIFINQLREKIGVMFGNPETTTGGNALKFYASVRLDVRRSITKENSTTDEAGNKTGNQVTVKVVKCKVAPPFRSAQFDIVYGVGIDKNGEMLEASIELGIINKSAATYCYEENRLAVGKEKLMAFLADNPELVEEIKKKVEEKLNT